MSGKVCSVKRGRNACQFETWPIYKIMCGLIAGSWGLSKYVTEFCDKACKPTRQTFVVLSPPNINKKFQCSLVFQVF